MINQYKVWCPDDGETINEARLFEGHSHRHAAELWAESLVNEDDYRFLEQQSAVVVVHGYAVGKMRTLWIEVHCVFEPTFHAFRIEPKEKP